MADEESDIPKVVPSENPTVTETELTEAADKVVEAAFKKAKEESADNAPTPQQMARGLGGGGPQYTDEQIREELAWIPGRFKEFCKPDPADFDDLISRISTVANEFGATGEGLRETDRGAFFIAQDKVGTWDGAMANNFNKNYLSAIPGIMANHGRLATLLHAEICKTQEMYKARRKNAKDIADKTVEAIEAITDSNGADVPFFLAAIIAVGTFMTLGTGAVALTGAGLISGATLAGPFNIGKKETPELQLGADDVRGVIDNMKKALDEIDKSVDEEQNTLIEAMERTDLMVHPHLFDLEGNKGSLLLPLKPDLAGAKVDTIKESFTQFK